MTKPTLAFQPEADRYYAEGHWRRGRPLGGLRPPGRRAPGQGGADPRRPRGHLRGARRAAIGVSSRLADGGVQPGDVVILLGRHSIEAAVAMLGCLHRGVVLAPLPPMFNATQLSALLAQTQAKGLVSFGGEKEIAKCMEVADEVPFLLGVLPELVDELAASDLPADRDAARRRRPRHDPALLRDHLGPEGDLALEQHPALRHRGRVPPLAADGRGRLPRRVRVRLRRRAGLRLLPAAAQRRHRRPREPLERR